MVKYITVAMVLFLLICQIAHAQGGGNEDFWLRSWRRERHPYPYLSGVVQVGSGTYLCLYPGGHSAPPTGRNAYGGWICP